MVGLDRIRARFGHLRKEVAAQEDARQRLPSGDLTDVPGARFMRLMPTLTGPTGQKRTGIMAAVLMQFAKARRLLHIKNQFKCITYYLWRIL